MLLIQEDKSSAPKQRARPHLSGAAGTSSPLPATSPVTAKPSDRKETMRRQDETIAISCTANSDKTPYREREEEEHRNPPEKHARTIATQNGRFVSDSCFHLVMVDQ